MSCSPPRSSEAALTECIERMLASTFDHDACVVVRGRDRMRAIVERAPSGFGGDPARFRYYVIFLKAPLTAGVAI